MRSRAPTVERIRRIHLSAQPIGARLMVASFRLPLRVPVYLACPRFSRVMRFFRSGRLSLRHGPYGLIGDGAWLTTGNLVPLPADVKPATLSAGDLVGME